MLPRAVCGLHAARIAFTAAPHERPRRETRRGDLADHRRVAVAGKVKAPHRRAPLGCLSALRALRVLHALPLPPRLRRALARVAGRGGKWGARREVRGLGFVLLILLVPRTRFGVLLSWNLGST
jgi:hypothetical protein